MIQCELLIEELGKETGQNNYLVMI